MGFPDGIWATMAISGTAIFTDALWRPAIAVHRCDLVLRASAAGGGRTNRAGASHRGTALKTFSQADLLPQSGCPSRACVSLTRDGASDSPKKLRKLHEKIGELSFLYAYAAGLPILKLKSR